MVNAVSTTLSPTFSLKKLRYQGWIGDGQLVARPVKTDRLHCLTGGIGNAFGTIKSLIRFFSEKRSTFLPLSAGLFAGIAFTSSQ
jgi:hypothetical protein